MSSVFAGLAVLLPVSITALTFSFVNPVFPILAQQRQLSSFVQSFFFALYSLPCFFIFLCLPSLERKCGAKSLYLAHMLCSTFATLLMSSLSYIYSVPLFSVTCLLLQFLNGVGGAGISYQYFTLSKRLFPSHFTLMNELPISLYIFSYGLAPMISAPATAFYGFHVACYTIAAISFAITLYARWFLPAQGCEPLLQPTSLPFKQTELVKKLQKQQLSYCEFLKKPRVFSSVLILFLAYFLNTYFLPFFALALFRSFQVPVSSLGNFFLVSSLAGLVSATPGIFVLRSFIKLSTIIAIGVLMGLIGNILMGFCPLFKIPEQIGYIWTGLLFLGVGVSLMSVPFLPYIVSYYQKHTSEFKGIEALSQEEKKDQIFNRSVGVYSVTLGLGPLLGPVVGKYLFQWFGYEPAFAVGSGLLVILGTLFLICGGVFGRGEEQCIFEERRGEAEEEQVLLKSESRL